MSAVSELREKYLAAVDGALVDPRPQSSGDPDPVPVLPGAHVRDDAAGVVVVRGRGSPRRL